MSGGKLATVASNANRTSGASSFLWISLSIIACAILILQLALLGSSSSNFNRHLSITRPEVNGFENPLIILVGLPRSGSLAVHQYMECHDMRSIHYCCEQDPAQFSKTEFPCQTCGNCVLKNMQAHQPAFEKCSPITDDSSDGHRTLTIWSRFDVETAQTWFLPQQFALGLLHEAYPEAIWILQTRESSREWAESIYHWHSMTRRIFDAFGVELDPPHVISQAPNAKTKVSKEEIELDMERQLEARVYNQTEHLRKLAMLERIYDNHTSTIYHWAQQFDAHNLLHINVDDAQSSMKTLNNLLNNAGTKSRDGCAWTFRSPTDDWKDFSFPF